MMADLLFLGLGLVIGFGTGWLCYRGRLIARCELAEEQVATAEKQLTAVQIENAKASERIRLIDQSLQQVQTDLGQERQFNISLHAELSRERTSRNHLDQKLEHQKQELLQLQQRLSHEIRLLVQQVLEEKSQTLSDLNTHSLNTIIQPISEKLQEFKQKVEEQHYRETRELIVLHNKIDHLEATRRTHPNGTGSHLSVHGHINGSEPEPGADESGSQYIPPALEPTPPVNGANHVNGVADQTESSAIQETPNADHNHVIEEVRPFLPKQQVEIDNFLKRTLGRAQRKKNSD